jgi:2-polyprenyl-3-methyl-5-hydroxy-6-metoxy-1,4-benzoquinol methylase
MTQSQKINIVRDFSQKRSNYFDANYGVETPANYLRRLRRELITKAVGGRANGAIVADAGCGPTILYPEVLERCRRYVALDLTPANLEEVSYANRTPKLECIIGDLDTYAWPKCAFDIVICSGAIEYTDDPENVLNGLAHSVKPGGMLVCSFPNAKSPYRIWSEWAYTPLGRIWRRVRGRPAKHYRRTLFFPNRIRKCLAASSRKIDIRYFGYKMLPQPVDMLCPKWDHAISVGLEGRCPRACAGLSTEFLAMVTL